MKKILVYSLLSLMAVISCNRQESMEELTARVFERASSQFLILDAKMDSVLVADGGHKVVVDICVVYKL